MCDHSRSEWFSNASFEVTHPAFSDGVRWPRRGTISSLLRAFAVTAATWR